MYQLINSLLRRADNDNITHIHKHVDRNVPMTKQEKRGVTLED